MGLLQYLPFLVLSLATVPPFIMIARKAGLSAWWGALGVLPLGFILFAWIIALRRWPATIDAAAPFRD